jgi:hypothetical protein
MFSISPYKKTILSVLMLVINVSFVFAQNPEKPVLEPDTVVKVIERTIIQPLSINSNDSISILWKQIRSRTFVKSVRREDDTARMSEGGLGDVIIVTLNHEDSAFSNPAIRNSIRLSINGLPFDDIKPIFSNNDSMLMFELMRTTCDGTEQHDVWDILQQPEKGWKRPVTVSICTMTELPLKLDPKAPTYNFDFIIMRKLSFWLMTLFMIGILVLSIWAGKNRDIFRDDTGNPNEDLKAPYSLSRLQLGFWTFIIVFSFLYIWAITGVLPNLTEDTLYLLGISVTTAGASRVLERMSGLNSAKAPTLRESSGSFWRDILTDDNGMSIHRAQMVVWTLIIGMFFVRRSISDFSMPDLNNNLLVLMGLSAGTYLGLKTQEKPLQANDAPTQENQQMNPAPAVSVPAPANPVESASVIVPETQDPTANTVENNADGSEEIHDEPPVG